MRAKTARMKEAVVTVVAVFHKKRSTFMAPRRIANGTASIASSPFVTRPSVDGASRDFYINGSAYTNALWWYKVAMLGWAVWLSFTLTRWIRWAWQVYSREGLWRHVPPRRRAAAPPAPPA